MPATSSGDATPSWVQAGLPVKLLALVLAAAGTLFVGFLLRPSLGRFGDPEPTRSGRNDAELSAVLDATDIGAAQGRRGPEESAVVSLANEQGALPVGSLTVHLLDTSHRPIPNAAVSIKHVDRPAVVGEAKEDGTYLADELPPGEYWVEVDAAALGFMSPWLQSKALYRRTVEVRPDMAAEISITLFKRSTVSGYVRAPGAPQPVLVRFFSQAPHRRWQCQSVEADENGFYSVEVEPGVWRSNVHLLYARPEEGDPEHPWYWLTKPMPQVFDLQEGADYRLNLCFGGGDAAITGRVVDLQTGDWAPGMLVVCFPWRSADERTLTREYSYGHTDEVLRTRSDETGRFVLGNLQPGTYGVMADPRGYRPEAGLGENRLGKQPMPVQPISVRGVTEIEPLEIWSSRPFIIRGRVQLDPVWARDNGETLDTLTGRLILPRLREDLSERDRRFKFNADGEFATWCETPEGTVRVEVHSASGVVCQIADIQPLPGQEMYLDLVVPDSN